jgi:hypothetical protein
MPYRGKIPKPATYWDRKQDLVNLYLQAIRLKVIHYFLNVKRVTPSMEQINGHTSNIMREVLRTVTVDVPPPTPETDALVDKILEEYLSRMR